MFCAMPEDRSELERSVAALLQDMGSGTPALASACAPAVRRQLAMRISRRLRCDAELIDDALDDALDRFDRYVAQREVDGGRAAGLLTVMAIRAALDRLRRQDRLVVRAEIDPTDLSPPAPSAEDVVLAMLDRRASADLVLRGLRRAMELDRLDLVEIVRTWLDLADSDSRLPSQRQVAAQLGVSHMTVSRALVDFAALLGDIETDT